MSWMKLTKGDRVTWIEIEDDVIVHVLPVRNLGLRADDTLSQWTRGGGEMEGPFREPK